MRMPVREKKEVASDLVDETTEGHVEAEKDPEAHPVR